LFFRKWKVIRFFIGQNFLSHGTPKAAHTVHPYLERSAGTAFAPSADAGHFIAMVFACTFYYYYRCGKFMLCRGCSFPFSSKEQALFQLFAIHTTGLPGGSVGMAQQHNQDSAVVLATLQEPLVEKQASYKAEATICILQNRQLQPTAGRIVIYFKKDSGTGKPPLEYGSQIILNRPLQPMKNAGNPGGFDYQRYALFHHLFYQVFLARKDFTVQPQKQITPFRQHLFTAQQWVLSTFKKYIPGQTESGMAEALLIGYRNDLDRDLVQRYSNTGVVHIIAISGMHLGLIYWLVLLPFKPLQKRRGVLVAQAIAAIAVLWFFSFLTGASPSILRSAVMFSFIALGLIGQRRSSIYNNLALSAFLILLFDPFSLWDVGFQLSYAAVLSIVVFSKPIQNGIYVKNKWLRPIWQLIAVTIAAQILTYPLVAYHFHQFPTLFLLTNLIAVPLSTGLIFTLIALLVAAGFSALSAVFVPAAKFVGLVVHWAIEWLNHFIDWVDGISFSLIDQIYFTIPMTICLFLFIAAAGWWLLRHSPRAMVAALFALAFFVMLYTIQFTKNENQHQLIVYNVPQHTGIDVVQGRQYLFVGDDELLEDGFLQNFHLKPSRVLHQMALTHQLSSTTTTPNAVQIGKTRMVIVSSKIYLNDTASIHPDIVLLTSNANLKLEEVNRIFHPQILVADASNKYYRIKRWQEEAAKLSIPFHAVTESGAYVKEW
jgi:competence protein ComEC